METAIDALLSPFDLHGLPLKNRVVMSPLTRSRAGEQRMPNALMAEYYGQRASAGLIITEATVNRLQLRHDLYQQLNAEQQAQYMGMIQERVAELMQ